MPSNFDLVTTSVDYIGLTLSGYPHVVSYSSIDMLPGIPHIDQLEIERLFDTGAKTGATVFTIADRRKMFKLPKNWYTINETTKQISILQFSTIANANVTFNLTTGLGLKYYAIDDANTSVVIPNLGANDTIIIRRKTLSEEKIVNFTAGSRLTSGQLNLSSNQLINIIQELLWKVDNEVIIKYDKDAIDGPFLGTFNGAFMDVTGNIDMNGQRVTNLGYSGTLDDAMPKKEITDTVFRHGVITKDTTPTNSPGTQNDIIEGNANEGRSGVWFNPQDGKLRAWAGNNWVIVTNAINPAVNPFLVQTNTAQSLSGQKTFLAPTTFDSTVTMTSNLAVNGGSVTLAGDLAVNGGDITTSSTGTATVFNNNATTLCIGEGAPTVFIGATTGTATIRNATTALTGNATVGGTLNVTGATTLSSTLNVTGATTLSSTLNVTGATTLSSTLNVTGNTTTPTAVVNAVKFPAVQVASADVNTLDDYVEGDWTPTLRGATTAGTFTYSVQQGKYTKIGRLVTVHANVIVASVSGSPAGALEVAGLPFSAGGGISVYGPFLLYHFGITSSKDYSSLSINTGQNYFSSAGGALGVDGTQTEIPASNVGASDYLRFTATFIV